MKQSLLARLSGLGLVAYLVFVNYPSTVPSPAAQAMEDEVRFLAKQTGLKVNDFHCRIHNERLGVVTCHVNRYNVSDVSSRFTGLGWVAIAQVPYAVPVENRGFKKDHKFLVLKAGLNGDRPSITVGGFVGGDA